MNFKTPATFLLVIGLVACTPRNDRAGQTSDQGKEAPTGERTKHTEIYDNGQVKIQGWEVDGVRVGDWESFYENGVKWSQDHFNNGKKDGKTVTYYPNGIMRYRGYFLDDKKAGDWQFYDEEGKLVKEVDFNK